MTTNDYKQKFIDLFKEMEQELGDCDYVEVERTKDISFGDSVVWSYECRMKFCGR